MGSTEQQGDVQRKIFNGCGQNPLLIVIQKRHRRIGIALLRPLDIELNTVDEIWKEFSDAISYR